MQTSSRGPRRSLAVIGPVLLASLSGCGLTVERTSRLDAMQRDLAAAETQGGVLRQRVAELESTLAAERQAAGDLAVLDQRLAQARASLAAAQRGRATAEVEVRAQRPGWPRRNAGSPACNPRPGRWSRARPNAAAAWRRPSGAWPGCRSRPAARIAG
ncbi:hypothetical protein ACFQU2_08105 [Siccirubricoccus deserti]